jgi:hypothetical protein
MASSCAIDSVLMQGELECSTFYGHGHQGGEQGGRGTYVLKIGIEGNASTIEGRVSLEVECGLREVTYHFVFSRIVEGIWS